MTTVVDELVIKLGLDNTSFRQQITQAQEGVRKVSDETQKQAKLIEAAGDRAASFFNKLRNEALALFALFLGTNSIKNFFQQVTQADAAVGRAAANIGIATQELSAWQGAVQRAGGSAEGLTRSMETMTQDYQNWLKFGQESQVAPVLNSMGIAYRDEKTGEMRPIADIYKDIADQFSKMSMPAALSLGKQMGMDEGTVRLLHMGREEVDKLLARQRELGTVSDADTKAAITLTNAFMDMKDAITDIGRAIVTDLSPYLSDLLKGMTEWILKNKEWLKDEIGEKVRAFGDWLKAIDWKQIHTDFDNFITKVNAVADALGGWMRISEALLGLWIGSKFLSAIAGIARLTGVIATNPVLMALLGIAAGGYLAHERGTDEAIAGNMGFRASGAPGSVDEAGNVLMWVNPKTGETIDALEMRERVKKWKADNPDGGVQKQSFTTDMSMSPEKKGFLDALAGGESKSYTDRNPTSTAHGRYQFINSTEAEIVGATGVSGDDPASQDKRGWYLAARTYNRETGRDLEADLRAGGHDDEIATALNKVWPSLPGGSQQNTSAALWRSRLAAGRQRYATPDPSLLKGSQAATVTNNRNTTSTTNTTDTNTHINGPINIQTAATDADGIAKGIGPALRKYMPVTEANYGLA